MKPLDSLRHDIEQRLQRIQALEPEVQAWTYFDVALVEAQVQRLETLSEQQRGPCPLWGWSIGLKDIIDTADMPTENGTLLHKGRQPLADAQVVRQLREAGAVIMGKTVTTELATYAPGKTRNPHNTAHTPGGSSSGSAAAVACGMVRAALGSQTNGSTIRPASFCGVVGYKPSRDVLDRKGVLVQSPTFDTVGLFASSVDDVEQLACALGGLKPALQRDASATPLRWLEGPYFDRIAADHQSLLRLAARHLNAQALDADLAVPMTEIVALHGLIMEAEIARSFAREYEQGAAQLSASLRGQIERGQATTDAQLQQALRDLLEMRRQVDAGWPQSGQRPAWLLMPSAIGTAPQGLHATGDPVMCTMATALDLPALNLPGLQGQGGLPLGLQLVGPRGSDADTLQAARAVHTSLRALSL